MLFLPAMPTSLATNLVMVFDCAITLPSHVTCGTKPNLVAESKWITCISLFVQQQSSLQFLTWFCCSPFLNLESFVLKLDSSIIEDRPDDLYPPISVKVQNFNLWSHCVGQIWQRFVSLRCENSFVTTTKMFRMNCSGEQTQILSHDGSTKVNEYTCASKEEVHYNPFSLRTVIITNMIY